MTWIKESALKLQIKDVSPLWSSLNSLACQCLAKKKQCGEFDEFVSLKQFLGTTLTPNGLV